MMERHLVLGATGQVGRELLRALADQGLEAIGSGLKNPADVAVDLARPEDVARVLDAVRPTVVWVAAALTHVDGCEADPHASLAINVRGPEAVASWARRHEARVVFFSTDYVFDGASGPYGEDDPTNPLSVYGRHKLWAEQRMLNILPGGVLVLRTCWVYGRGAAGQGFIDRLVASLASGSRVRLPADQWGNPTAAPDLAAAAVDLLQRGASGVWHAAGPEWMSRAEWGMRVAKRFGVDASLIDPAPTSTLSQAAPRPLRGGLESFRTAARLGRALWDAAEGLGRLAAP
jgi:dTDP-4-dehydrorhamnose reductase